jgi:(p)ppGpp synthase/HD superfamily hydrolase
VVRLVDEEAHAVTLEDAIAAAAKLHRGQRDKAGAVYVLHPLRVMMAVETEQAQILAVLHDTVEDAGWEALRQHVGALPSWLEEGLDALSRRSGETYDDFIARVDRHPLARIVKLADLADNMDLSRIREPTMADHQRVEKYRRARTILLTSISLREG